jgi:hypothetical protein
MYGVNLPYGAGSPATKRQKINKTNGVPYGIRTRVANVKGWCPGPLDERDRAPPLGKRAFPEGQAGPGPKLLVVARSRAR